MVAAAVLYAYGLNDADAYLSIEEAQHARQAHSLATTGRDVMGEKLPMYFAQPDFLAGRDPVWVYFSGAILTVMPFSEAVIRLPSLAAGLANIALFYLIGKRLFGSSSMGAAAAALMALTPAHFIQSRIATSQIAPATCVLVWFYFLLLYLDERRLRDLLIAVGSLGVALYTYLPAAFTMPLFFAATVVLLLRETAIRDTSLQPAPTSRRPIILCCAVFAATVVPLVLWHVLHPERLTHLRDYYTANGYNRSATTIFSWPGLLHRADLWWNAFNPGGLLFSGDANLRFSTREVGHVLLPSAVLIAAALVRGLADLRPPARGLVLAGLLIGPIPAVLAGDYEIKRWLVVIPFLTLTALAGVAALRRLPRLVVVPTLLVIGVASALQFALFLADYHGDYRARSAVWFGGNMKGAIGEVMRVANDPHCVLIDKRVYPDYWPLYTAVMGRRDLAAATNVVDVADSVFAVPADCSAAQLIVSRELVRENAAVRTRLETPQWSPQTIAEPRGEPLLLVYHYSSVRTISGL